MGYKRKPNYLILSFYFTLIGNGTVLRLQLDTHTALPLLAWAVNSHFQVFLRSERKEPANCSFTAALTGGKLDSPVFLLYERRKTGTQTQDRFVSLFCFPFYILIWSREGA